MLISFPFFFPVVFIIRNVKISMSFRVVHYQATLMPVQFFPVQEPDLPDLTRLFLTAFEKDPLVGRLKSGLPENVRYEETLKYFLQLWGQRHIYGGRFWKAVEIDEEGAEGKLGYNFLFESILFFELSFAELHCFRQISNMSGERHCFPWSFHNMRGK